MNRTADVACNDHCQDEPQGEQSSSHNFTSFGCAVIIRAVYYLGVAVLPSIWVV